MTQEERLIEIKKLLSQKHQLSTKELAKHFKIAFDTARRDIIRLTSTGQAIRIHGGIVEIDQNDVPNYLARNLIQSPVKAKMAQKAQRFVHPGQCDFIGSSTTLRQMCDLLGKKDVQVVTNSIDCALALINLPMPKVRLLGGIVDKTNRFIYSEAALNTIRRIHFNTAFIGAGEVRADGVYSVQSEDANLIQTVISRANQVVLIAEKYKFTNERISPFMAAPINKIDVVITDTALPAKYRQFFKPNIQIISVL